MATTTKSKAKNKTTKKPASKASVNSSTKVSKATKSTTKQVTQAKSSAKTSKNVPFTDKLRRLNILSGVLGLALAVAAVFLMSKTTAQIFTGLMTNDGLASSTGTVFVTGIHSVFDLQLRWAVVGIMLVSAIIPLMSATRKRKMYEESVAKKVNVARWLELGVVTGLMIEIVALLSGVSDLSALKMMGALLVISAVLGWFWERQLAKSDNDSKSTYILSALTGIIPVVVIAGYALNTYLYGMVRYSWFVYALYATTLLVLMGYARNSMLYGKGKINYEVNERNYLRWSIFAKVTFALILIAGLYKK